MSAAKNSLKEKCGEIKGFWSPVDVANVNDHIIRVAIVKGEYRWHSHDADEFFHVLSGELIIQFREKPALTLHKGEVAVVPANLEHCPKSERETFILMFERSEG